MLENKLGITSAPGLAEAEERISKKKAIALFEKEYLIISKRAIRIIKKCRLLNLFACMCHFCPMLSDIIILVYSK